MFPKIKTNEYQNFLFGNFCLTYIKTEGKAIFKVRDYWCNCLYCSAFSTGYLNGLFIIILHFLFEPKNYLFLLPKQFLECLPSIKYSLFFSTLISSVTK